MATVFNGKFIVAPSTNVAVNTTNLANLSSGSSNTVAYIGTCTAGVPKQPILITDPGTAIAKLQSGNLLEAALMAFDPSSQTGGANNIYFVRVNSAIQSKVNVLTSAVNGTATPPVAATGTVTIAGTVAAADVVTVTIDGTAFSYTTLSTDTVTTIASALVSLINASTLGLFTASSSAGVITITATNAGVDGNSITLSATATGAITATASGSTLTGGVGILLLTMTSQDYGQYTNNLYYNISNSSTAYGALAFTVGLNQPNGGSFTFNVLGPNSSGSFGTIPANYSNYYSGLLFTIQYIGSGTAASLTITDTTFTTTVTGASADNLNISLANYSTIGQLFTYLEGTGKYAVSYDTSTSGVNVLPTIQSLNPLAQFDNITNVSIQTAPVQLSNTVQALVTYINSGSVPYVTATRGVNPVAISTANISNASLTNGVNIYFTGGSDGTSLTTDWSNAINSLQTVDCQVVVPVTDQAAIHAMAAAHVEYMSTTGNEPRVAVVGGALGEYQSSASVPTQTILNRAIALNSSRVVLCSPGIQRYNSQGIPTLFSSAYNAVLFGSMLAAVPQGTPLTHKSYSNILSLEVNYTAADIISLLENGVAPTKYKKNAGYFIVQSLTTWQGAPNFANNEISVVLAIDAVTIAVQNALNSQLIGSILDPTTISQAVSITETVLINSQNSGFIVGNTASPAFKNISASGSGDVITVQFQMSPAIPANYINVSISAVPFSGTVSTATSGS